MSKILILRNIFFTKFFVFSLSIALLVISILFPITMFLLNPILGMLGTIMYMYLIYKVLFKHSYFEEKIHSIDFVDNKLNIISSGFFKHKFKEHIFYNINDLVLTKHETAVPLGFRYFELSARIDGNKLIITRSLFRKTINTTAKHMSHELDLIVYLNDGSESKLIDSNKYNFNNLDYNYSYSPYIYLFNGLFFAAILPIGGIIPYICLPLCIWLFMSYFRSRQNLMEIKKQ